MMALSEGAKLTRQSQCETHGAFEESGMTLPFGRRSTIWSGCSACMLSAARPKRSAVLPKKKLIASAAWSNA